MLRSRNADAKATMSLKDRMKFFEAAAEAEKKKTPPRLSTPTRRSISSTGSSTGPSPTTTTPRRHTPRSPASGPGSVCTRVSLSRTISGESVVKEVLSPISLPTRTRIQEEDDDIFPPPPVMKDESIQDLNKCKFSEVRRDNVEVLDRTSTHYLATHVEPVENRVEEKVEAEARTLGDTDRDSGVSCSSDDQDQDALSDTEVAELRSVDSRDSGVFASKTGDLSKVQRVYIEPSSVESTDDTMTESATSESEGSETSAERAPTPVKSSWSALLNDDMEDNEEEENVREDGEGSESSNKDSEGTKAESLSEEDAQTLVDTSINEDDKAPFHSPFEGTINLSMTAKEAISSQPPSHKGFLTIFQDESGLGAWNRRWCSVQDNKIYYWLYPEDEVNQNKQPHGEIDLRNCKTETVSIASRLDCARPNTFVLVIMQAAQPGDRASIITESNGKTTQTKYMLSADSREERKQWMEVLNKCLQSVISWNH